VEERSGRKKGKEEGEGRENEGKRKGDVGWERRARYVGSSLMISRQHVDK
jgi:hypothetical protein